MVAYVKCIDTTENARNNLTLGKVYEVVKEESDFYYVINDRGFDSGGWDKSRFVIVDGPAEDTAENNGGSTNYYQLPAGATELGDLIEYKKMNFNRGNIFKATYRLGEKDAATEIYDLNKIIYFAQREIKRIAKESAND